jgi:transposase
VSERKRYPSDLTDERWALIEPVISAWKAAHRSVSGHQGGYEMREIINAILYQGRTGCQWDYLPHDLPPRSAAYYYFARWRDDGTDQAIHDTRLAVPQCPHRITSPVMAPLSQSPCSSARQVTETCRAAESRPKQPLAAGRGDGYVDPARDLQEWAGTHHSKAGG